MDLLHLSCGGLIETFVEDWYGLCQACGEEGYFKVVKEKEDDYAFFYDTTMRRSYDKGGQPCA